MPRPAHAARSLVALLALSTACAARQAPPPPSHTGWTLRYTQRVGEGSTTARDVRPEVAMAVLDGVARMSVRERGVEARVDSARSRVELCRGACVASDQETAMLAVAGIVDLPRAMSVREEAPVTERIDDPLSITNVPTQGARFVGAVQSSQGTLQFTLTVRWIDEPGERSVEVVKDFFLAPLVRMGAAQLVREVRRSVGLPLHWEIRIVTRRADGSSGEGSVVYHAAEMANPPAAL
ncbi:MAG: hypothetical protein WCJ30_03415 [Deltaproteobacteria bacterium]